MPQRSYRLQSLSQMGRRNYPKFHWAGARPGLLRASHATYNQGDGAYQFKTPVIQTTITHSNAGHRLLLELVLSKQKTHRPMAKQKPTKIKFWPKQ
jgi:hypothetical protein